MQTIVYYSIVAAFQQKCAISKHCIIDEELQEHRGIKIQYQKPGFVMSKKRLE